MTSSRSNSSSSLAGSIASSSCSSLDTGENLHLSTEVNKEEDLLLHGEDVGGDDAEYQDEDEEELYRPPAAVTKVSSVIEKGQGTAEKKWVLDWDELEPWQQSTSPLILTHHRPATASHLASLRSMFRCHNETVNIWVHVLATVVFAGWGICFWVESRAEMGGMEGKGREEREADMRAVVWYFGGCVVCFLFSSVYHTSLSHSARMHTLTSHMDYLSILAPLLTTTHTSIHFTFPTSPRLKTLYTTTSTTLTLLAALVTLSPHFRTPTAHIVRTAVYTLLALSSFLPIVHGVVLHGLEEQNRRQGLLWYLALGVCHAVGAGVYAARWPERRWPGVFDLWGSSHQVMHVCVVVGAGCGAVGVLGAYGEKVGEGV